MNTIYYWPDLGAPLREIARVLKPGGRLALAFCSPATLWLATSTWDKFRRYEPEEVAEAMRKAGFRLVRVVHQNVWRIPDNVIVVGECRRAKPRSPSSELASTKRIVTRRRAISTSSSISTNALKSQVLYLSLHGDIVSELTENSAPLGTGFGDRRMGIRCHRRWPNRELYDPESALARCAVHAENFVQRSLSQVAEICGWLPRPPVIVGSFDAEHFGHWWYGGPIWLDLVIRKFACEHTAIRLITAEEYLRLYPENQMITPAMSSWGYQGYSESWLMGRNHWIYPELFERAERLRGLARDCRPDPLIERALAEYVRELMQAQASDWAYIMHAYPDMHYAGQRIRRHLETMDLIEQGVQTNSLNAEWLAEVERRNALFRDLDVLGIYRAILRSG